MAEILPLQADATEHPPAPGRPTAVILGKDGKPCKTCTAFRDLLSLPIKRAKPPTTTTLPDHCPPDVEVLGRATWTFLHTMAANFPERPSKRDQNDMTSFMRTLGKFYPCWSCAEDFRAWMDRGNEPRVGTRRQFERWMCAAHNEVNKKLGKREFDCSEQSLRTRWGEGPSDGSCG
jgi:mitochondrial FAD-linked sulfhydryl oxidase